MPGDVSKILNFPFTVSRFLTCNHSYFTALKDFSVYPRLSMYEFYWIWSVHLLPNASPCLHYKYMFSFLFHLHGPILLPDSPPSASTFFFCLARTPPLLWNWIISSELWPCHCECVCHMPCFQLMLLSSVCDPRVNCAPLTRRDVFDGRACVLESSRSPPGLPHQHKTCWAYIFSFLYLPHLHLEQEIKY